MQAKASTVKVLANKRDCSPYLTHKTQHNATHTSHHHTHTTHTHITGTVLCVKYVSHSGVVDCGMLLGVVVLSVVVCVASSYFELMTVRLQGKHWKAGFTRAGRGGTHLDILRLNVIYDQPEEFAVSPRSTLEQLSLWHSQ